VLYHFHGNFFISHYFVGYHAIILVVAVLAATITKMNLDSGESCPVNKFFVK